jgi:hypothetical protein
MNSGQKVIVCVALGAALVVLGFGARALWWEPNQSGWYNYAPNSGVVFTGAGVETASILRQVAVWIGLVLLWAAACLFVLRDSGTRRPESASEPQA